MAWKRWNKTPTRRPPEKTWTPEEMKMIGFVMKKGINISISPDFKHQFYNWQIDIKIGNGKVHTDPNRYSDEDVHENVIKYYKYYYDKYNKNSE